MKFAAFEIADVYRSPFFVSVLSRAANANKLQSLLAEDLSDGKRLTICANLLIEANLKTGAGETDHKLEELFSSFASVHE